MHIIDNIQKEGIEINEFGLLEHIKTNFEEHFQITQFDLEEIFNDSEGKDDKYNEYYDEKEYNEIIENITSKV